ncbi:MAG TPA: TonB-dependent receptor [Terriglobales bacterium]|nr:TonB-dependent receptor [Terriglobales bacterium]
MRTATKFAFRFFLFALMTTQLWAQGVATADLSGTVTDPNGAVVAGAQVALRDEARAFERMTISDDEGVYQFLLVPPGRYSLTVEAKGFAKLVNTGVVLTIGQSAELPVSLRVAGAEAVVEVTAETELVETTRSSGSTTIVQQSIENLPINGRNYINFTLTNSQVKRDTAPSIGVAPTSGLNFGGQRARSNLVNVDGADAVDNSVNGIRSTVSQEAVQEFQIITNGYNAEYGRASGGVVNIITRSGTNALHGNLFGYLRHRDIQADNPFTTVANPAFTRVQAGATLGGPIKKDKTFFFFSYETTRRQESGFSTVGSDNFGLVPFDASAFFGAPPGFVSIQATPAQAAFLGGAPVNALTMAYAALVGRSSGAAIDGVWPGLLAAPCVFPTPTPGTCFASTGIPLNGDFVPLQTLVGNYPISEGTTVVAMRLDHRFNANQTALLRVNVSPSSVTGIQVNAQNQNFGQNAFSRTSAQDFRDVNVIAQHTWLIGSNKVNEFRFQFARRGLLYTFSRQGDTPPPLPGDSGTNPDGGQVAFNIPGFAFFGREPFSFADRVEKRYQFTDNFSILKGNHNIKFGADINRVPVDADFTVNFGGLYNIGSLGATSLSPLFAGFPNFSPVQAYGLGIPQVFIQQVGDPHYAETITSLGVFLQDSWRIKPNFTLNIGVRYDVEWTPEEAALNPLADAAQNALNITQGIPMDTNNIAPRIGIAWDPWKDGKTVIRANYGLFFDHPLVGLAFLSQVADGAQAPGIVLFGGSPCTGAGVANPLNLNATNVWQGTLTLPNCVPPAVLGGINYIQDEARFEGLNSNSLFVNQNYLTAGVPLAVQPFGFPISSRFKYGYSNQASLSVERDLGHDFALSVNYNFVGGRHLNRSIDINPPNTEALIANWERAVAAGAAAPATLPVQVSTCGLDPLGRPFVPAALVSFFRISGLNPSLAAFPPLAPCLPLAAAVMAEFGLGLGVDVPFNFMNSNVSSGSSVYHGMTVNLKKRFSRKYEFLASYTWSHAIDDSTDLQSLLQPQDARFPDLERSNSTFDQRHRFVFSGVYQSGRLGGGGFWSRFFSDWTVAPILEISSGRPFLILVGSDRNFDFGSNTDRPLQVAPGTTNLCGDVAVPSQYSSAGAFIPACHIDGIFTDSGATLPLVGNTSRNAGTRPYTIFTDLRVARRIHFSERVKLDAIMDIFNLPNRFNVADVNVLFSQAGTPTSAFDPRQFQFALKLSW